SPDTGANGSGSRGASRGCSSMAEPALYLRSVAARLTGSRRARRRLLMEIRGHVEDAVAAGLEAGLDAREAERRALERPGPTAAARPRSRSRHSSRPNSELSST